MGTVLFRVGSGSAYEYEMCFFNFFKKIIMHIIIPELMASQDHPRCPAIEQGFVQGKG